MNEIYADLRNYRTTILGVTLAVLTYVSGVGAELPDTGAEWLQFFVSMALAALGVVAKDAAVGSKP